MFIEWLLRFPRTTPKPGGRQPYSPSGADSPPLVPAGQHRGSSVLDTTEATGVGVSDPAERLSVDITTHQSADVNAAAWRSCRQ